MLVIVSESHPMFFSLLCVFPFFFCRNLHIFYSNYFYKLFMSIVSSGLFWNHALHPHMLIASETSLFAHHVQKKIIKRKQDRRPIKSRLSDIERNNVNLNKCITKVEGAPADYTMVSADDYMKVREKALLFWENGSPSTEWLQITEEDMILTLPQNIEPLPVGGVQKRPNLVRSGTC